MTTPRSFDLKEFEMQDKIVRWNPLVRLFESRQFPFARVLRSKLWQRIKDTYSILNGSAYEKNELGLLDYVFPIPRLLANLYALDQSDVGKLVVAMPLALAIVIKTLFAGLTTIVCIPLVVVVHLVIQFFSFKEAKDQVMVKPIQGDVKSFSDLKGEQHFSPAMTLSSFEKIHQQLVSKPLAKVYPGDQERRELAFGLYSRGVPVGVIDIDTANKSGIYHLMQENQYRMSSHLEEEGQMENALKSIR